MKYLHQVSYLRLQDVIGVCLSYCCLSSTTCVLVLPFYKKLKNVSCEYDRWVVETKLCKLCDTSDTLIGRACAMFQLKYGVCGLHIYDMVVDT